MTTFENTWEYMRLRTIQWGNNDMSSSYNDTVVLEALSPRPVASERGLSAVQEAAIEINWTLRLRACPSWKKLVLFCFVWSEDTVRYIIFISNLAFFHFETKPAAGSCQVRTSGHKKSCIIPPSEHCKSLVWVKLTCTYGGGLRLVVGFAGSWHYSGPMQAGPAGLVSSDLLISSSHWLQSGQTS